MKKRIPVSLYKAVQRNRDFRLVCHILPGNNQAHTLHLIALPRAICYNIIMKRKAVFSHVEYY